MEKTIPCTVQLLCRNSMPGIQTCLESLKPFAEVILQDGSSTDGTREAAQTYANVRLLDQDKTLLDADGRIVDFATMRNAGMRAATYDWILMVDSDEEVEPALITEVAEIVERNIPGVYRAFRRFFVDGEPVIHCAGYPAYHIRLYHRSCVEGYVKPVHERLSLHAGVVPQILRTELKVPLPPPQELEAKHRRYLQMEVKRLGVMPWRRWFRWELYRNTRSILGLIVLTAGIWLSFKKGKRMPIAYEWQAVRQLFWTTVLTFPPLAVRRK